MAMNIRLILSSLVLFLGIKTTPGKPMIPSVLPPSFTSRSFHPSFKLTVHSNPNAVKRKGIFPGNDVEWVPLDPLEYQNASGSQEWLQSTHRKLTHTPNDFTKFTAKTSIDITKSKKGQHTSDVLWTKKLSADTISKLQPLQPHTNKAGSAVKESKSESSPPKKSWIPVSLSIPITPKNISNSTLHHKWNDVPYYNLQDPLTPEVLNGFVAPHTVNFPALHVAIPHPTHPPYMKFPWVTSDSYKETTTSRPSTTSTLSSITLTATAHPYIKYPWATSGSNKKTTTSRPPTTSTLPSTTYSITAHPLFVTTDEQSNEIFMSTGEDLDLDEIQNTINSKETPIASTTNEPQNNDRTYMTTQLYPYPYPPNFNGYGPPPPIHPDWQYTTLPPYNINDHSSVNELASFLVTISSNDISQAQAATVTKKPPKRPQPSSRWGLNRLQRLLLAIGMSAIPTAAMAIIVGFPSLLAGRKKRDAFQEGSVESILRQIHMLDKNKTDIWMKNADIVLQRYCAQFDNTNKKSKILRGNRAWNGVTNILKNFLRLNWNFSEPNIQGGVDGIVYYPANSNMINVTRTKHRGNGTNPNRNKVDLDKFVCDAFFKLSRTLTDKVIKKFRPIIKPKWKLKRANHTKSFIQMKRRLQNSKFAADQFQVEAKYANNVSNNNPMTVIIVKDPQEMKLRKPVPLRKKIPSHLLPVEHKVLPELNKIWKRSVPIANSKVQDLGLRKMKATVSKVKDGIGSDLMPRTVKTIVGRRSKGAPKRRVYIYHVYSNPIENVTKVKSKTFAHKPSMEEKADYRKVKKMAKQSTPTIFRIPIHVENSTPEYMHIIGKPIHWPFVSQTPDTHWLNANFNSLKYPSTTEKVVAQTEDSIVKVNRSSIPPTTINIYTFHGLQNELLTQLLNNINNTNNNNNNNNEENQSEEDYEDLPLTVTTKRPPRPTRRPLRTSTRKYRPVTIRSGIKIRTSRPRPQNQQVPPGCDPDDDECDPVEPTLPSVSRPNTPVNKKPIFTLISPLELLLSKFGLHGGLVPLFDLGNVAKIVNKFRPWLLKRDNEAEELQLVMENPERVKSKVDDSNVLRKLLYEELTEYLLKSNRKKNLMGK